MDTTGYPAEPTEAVTFPVGRTAAWSAMATRLRAVSQIPAQREDVAA